MKKSLSELRDLGPLGKVAIRSLDLSLYLAEVELGGQRQVICHDDGRPLRAVNLVAMREMLQGLQIESLVLVQESAYDEMIGQPARLGSNALEVPLSLEAQPATDH